MAGSLNKVMLIGNLGRDPDIRTMPNNSRIATFSLATSESWTDKDTGERKDKTQWHRIVVFNEHTIGIIERFVRKGSKVYVAGQLETRQWITQEGQERYTTEIIIRNFRGELILLGGDVTTSDMRGEMSTETESSLTQPRTALSQGERTDLPEGFDDEIPF